MFTVKTYLNGGYNENQNDWKHTDLFAKGVDGWDPIKKNNE